jgi:hypothetical protein
VDANPLKRCPRAVRSACTLASNGRPPGLGVLQLAGNRRRSIFSQFPGVVAVWPFLLEVVAEASRPDLSSFPTAPLPSDRCSVMKLVWVC